MEEPGKLRTCFVKLLESLLEGLHEVFPECGETENVLRLFRVLVKGDVARETECLRTCHELFRQHGDALKERDVDALFALTDGVELLRGLKLREKWEDPEFADASRESLWNYVTTLQSYAELHEVVPGKLLSKIERKAGELTEKLRRGELDLTSLDVAALGQAFSADLSEEELRNFESQLPKVLGSVANVMGAMGHPPGDFMAELSKTIGGGDFLAELSKTIGGGDAAALMKNVAPDKLMEVMKQLGDLPQKQLAAPKPRRRR
jgi:hypothetical protein